MNSKGREEMLEIARSWPFETSVSQLGPGIVVMVVPDMRNMFTSLLEDHGWYVASHRQVNGKPEFILMPVVVE